MAASGHRTVSLAEEPARDAMPAQRGRGGGRKARKGRHGGAFGNAAPPRPEPKPADGAAGDGGSQPQGLSANVQGMRFMQSAREEEQRKKQEQDQLRHLEDMQWIVPGFEEEVKEAEQSQEPEKKKAAQPAVLLHRRSYKGFNPVVEQCMKEQLKQQAAAARAAEELEEAEALQGMKRRRKGQQ
uniref:Uncharacterized protein n=1 Tax=Alexandrium catenella TaxID=2925 RepID=A0A7S1W1J7_ALECA